jgi:NAD(P)-dependent dehydrogenase (short-subunit alcohol dehydrogenase family)
VDPRRVVAVELDVTRPEQVERAAAEAREVSLLVNNGGIAGAPGHRQLIGAPDLADARLVMETDFWGQLAMCRAFAPILAANGGGAIVNILSVGALFSLPEYGSYSVAKWAAAAMSIAVRAELHAQGTHVASVFTAGVESDMSRNTPGPKMTAPDHARAVLDAVEAGVEDVYPGKAADFRDRIRHDPKAFEREVLQRYLTSPMK